MEKGYLYWIPLLPLLGALINLTVGRAVNSKRFIHTVAVGTVVGAFAIAVVAISGPLYDLFKAWRDGGGTAAAPALHQELYTWIDVGALKVDLAFKLDTLSAVMVLVITFVGSLIHIYSIGYMSTEPRYSAYFAYLNLFTGFMLILVLGDNLPVMFIGWEGVGLCSYLLIGFWFHREDFANAGRKAFVVNRIGDFAFLLGMFLIFLAMYNAGLTAPRELLDQGLLDFDVLRWADPARDAVGWQGVDAIGVYQTSLWGERMAMFAGILLFIGACGKSAQIPLYVWLPDAMAGPTPVSALIHAATMVTAGVYMVARMSFLFGNSSTAMAIVAGVGAATALFAAIMAFAQTDLKKVLAYSTVSQLGFMFVAVGVGAYTAGIFHLVTHAFFKAGLFLAAGSVMHAMSGSGDITTMGGLRKKIPWTHLCFLIFCLAIAGIFPFAGFFSKDEILGGAFPAQQAQWFHLYGEILWSVLTVAAVCTAFYMFRLYFLVFSGDCRADAETRAHIHESPATMVVPLIVLAVFSTLIGLIGMPHIDGLPINVIGEWLEPSVNMAVHPHAGQSLTIVLILIALGAAAIGIVAAYLLYGRGPSAVVARATDDGAGKAIHRVVFNKFYVDELYDLILVRPFRWVCTASFEFVDRFIIDLIFVNGLAFVVDVCGRVVRWFQNGQVQRYMAAVLVGAAAIFYFSSRVPAGFEYEQVASNQVQLFPSIANGPASIGAVIKWDLDGDGEGETLEVSPVMTVELGSEYRVTLWVTDGVFGKSTKVTQTVRLDRAEAPDPIDPNIKGAAQ